MAIFLGFRGGIGDARAGRPPYLVGVFFHSEHRREYLRTGLVAIRDIVALSIVLDAVAQLLIFRQVHPGAALLVGPVSISFPNIAAREREADLPARRTGPPPPAKLQTASRESDVP